MKSTVENSGLDEKSNVLLVSPLYYLDMLKLLHISICAISDSGGIQEEAPSFNTPVIILRETTERPEGVNQGIAFLVGTNKNLIMKKFKEIVDGKVVFNGNPYGDGNSSKQIVKYLKEL